MVETAVMNVRHSSKSKHDPRGSWLFILVVGVIALGVIGSAFSSYFVQKIEQRRGNWPQTAGKPIQTRVIQEPPTLKFPKALYVGQCMVEYVVEGKRYAVWTASEFRSADASWVTDKVLECPASRYVVRYNPNNPSDATAEQLADPH